MSHPSVETVTHIHTPRARKVALGKQLYLFPPSENTRLHYFIPHPLTERGLQWDHFVLWQRPRNYERFRSLQAGRLKIQAQCKVPQESVCGTHSLET